ncbi:MAG TPA: SRPBCC domain-containing protein [Acidimicrobiia bacterium]|jgi:uncharacterized protein YndB with AHSA1/START domain|nr:SRPBCC domain-containing protein [Acidimicrobiia bacterium]
MTTKTETTVTTQMYQVYIQATPEAIWEAITSPEWIEKYGYRGRAEYDLKPGGSYKAFANEDMKAMGSPDVVVEGEVIEADPPRRLVQTYRFTWSPDLLAEGFTKVIWETQDEGEGITRLTVTHELEGAPIHAEQVVGLMPLNQGGGGWAWILSDLKTLLETGKALGS